MDCELVDGCQCQVEPGRDQQRGAQEYKEVSQTHRISGISIDPSCFYALLAAEIDQGEGQDYHAGDIDEPTWKTDAWERLDLRQ